MASSSPDVQPSPSPPVVGSSDGDAALRSQIKKVKIGRAYLTDEVMYHLQIIWGLLNLVFSVFGLYFVYRWGVTLLATDEEVRRVLMGDTISRWVEGNNKTIAYLAAAYLSFKFVQIFITTTSWEINMEKYRREILKKREKRAIQQERRRLSQT